ncbi:hypothetical protein KAH55_03695, partial [bacterium]|nr:hypothetical protein [bacterium]
MKDSVKNSVKQPMIPLADNFTPRERTPWGGLKIAREYKNWLGLDAEQVIGESWEISGHKSFPNRFLVENDEVVTLPELLSKFPEEILGQKIAKKFDNRIPLLIKLLDAADNLSVQVHP